MNLLIDVCCGICLLGVLPQTGKNFSILVFNADNICCENEYLKRKDTFLKVCDYYKIENYLVIPYNHEKYLSYIKGFEEEKESGLRCRLCFEYRFENLFSFIEENKINNFNNENFYFTTTLSVSKFKNYNQIKAAAYNYLRKNNKKYDFYDNSFRNDLLYGNGLKLSRELGLYRQNFCGCEFSKK